MSKNVEDVVKALKLKTNEKNGALTFKLGAKKYSLPFEVRYLSSEGYLFVHIPPAAEIFQISDGNTKIIENFEEAKAAQASFRAPRKSDRSNKKASSVELPAELKSALGKIPSGHKLSYGLDGEIKLVKTRKRVK